MKTTWAKRELKRSGASFGKKVQELYESIRARHETELAKAGFFRRLILLYCIAAEHRREMSKKVEDDAI
jgi:hypothetical protein